MSSGISIISLGSAVGTGTPSGVTHASVLLQGPERIGFSLVVDAIGSTPTVTWKIQVSMDGSELADSASTWHDLFYIVPNAATAAATTARAVTTVSRDTIFPENPNSVRFFRKARLVTTLNTNVTYHGEVIYH